MRSEMCNELTSVIYSESVIIKGKYLESAENPPLIVMKTKWNVDCPGRRDFTRCDFNFSVCVGDGGLLWDVETPGTDTGGGGRTKS